MLYAAKLIVNIVSKAVKVEALRQEMKGAYRIIARMIKCCTGGLILAYQVNLVEDEMHLNSILTAYLEKEGYAVSAFSGGEKALEACDGTADLWVVDIMLPDTNGYTLFKEIRRKSPEVPIIFMSARNKEIDRVVGLEMGCDDYISKPFLPQELILRVRKLLEKQSAGLKRRKLNLSPYQICLDRRKIFAGEKEVELSTKEYELLLFFVRNDNIAVGRERILDDVWGEGYVGSDRVVDDTVRRLRKKLPELDIETIYGYGYCFKSEPL